MSNVSELIKHEVCQVNRLCELEGIPLKLEQYISRNIVVTRGTFASGYTVFWGVPETYDMSAALVSIREVYKKWITSARIR